MVTPLVVGYLTTHSLRDLYEDHGVVGRFSSDFSKISLNYDQIATKSGDKVAEQCRGLILRVPEHIALAMRDDFSLAREPRHTAVEASHWFTTVIGVCSVVAWPMNRFYNHGDVACAPVDWNDPHLRVYEKLDGTMIIMYWDEYVWKAATRSVPEADVPIRQNDLTIGGMTFAHLFFGTLEKCYYENVTDGHNFENWLDKSFDKNVTYVFELTSQHNRVVVKYDTNEVTLLAARNVVTGEELDPLKVCPRFVKTAPFFASLRDPVSIATFINASDPSKLEGTVACDSRFNRAKQKSLAWVMSSRAKDLVTVSRRNVITAVLNDKIDDVIPLIEKNIADEILKIQEGLVAYLKNVETTYLEIKNASNGDRKTFAMNVLATGDWTAPYFAVIDGRAPNTTAWIKQSSLDDKLPPKTLDMLLKKAEKYRC